MKYKQLIAFGSLFGVLYFLLFPSYRFLIDPDATGYLSVAEKVAAGKYWSSVNGIWSPLGSWLLVPFLKMSCDPIISAKVLNGFYGLLSLILFFYLLKKIRTHSSITTGALLVAIVPLLHFSFARLFGDMLLLVFLLAYLNIICTSNFGKSYRSIVFAALIGGLAFYAKAYSFYFVLLHLPLLILMKCREEYGGWLTKKSLKKIFIAVAVVVCTTSFWLITLQNKYGHFILGQKNVTGTLTAITDPKRFLIDPPSSGNYAGFDDVSNFHKIDVTPFSSVKLFIVQVKLIISNFLNLIVALHDFSFVFIAIIFLSIFAWRQKKVTDFNKNLGSLLVFTVLWICGFLFFSIQSRFLWITVLIALLLSATLLTWVKRANILTSLQFNLLAVLVLSSFCIYPLVSLKENVGRGRNLYEIANALKANSIGGRMCAYIRSSQDYSNSIVINYLNGSTYYGARLPGFTTAEFLAAIDSYKIDHLIVYYSTPIERENFLCSELVARSDSMYLNLQPGILVFRYKH